MALTNLQLIDIAKKMVFSLVDPMFKSQLIDDILIYNEFYIINIEDEYDQDGTKNEGTHYTCFQVNKYPNGKIEGVYLDPYGLPPPKEIIDFVGFDIPYNKKQIQGSLNNACGWFCLAFGHYINSYEGRTKDLYSDSVHFTDLFEDLTESNHHLKNEWVLKHFFRSKDPSKRKAIEIEGLDNISDANERTKIVL